MVGRVTQLSAGARKMGELCIDSNFSGKLNLVAIDINNFIRKVVLFVVGFSNIVNNIS